MNATEANTRIKVVLEQLNQIPALALAEHPEFSEFVAEMKRHQSWAERRVEVGLPAWNEAAA